MSFYIEVQAVSVKCNILKRSSSVVHGTFPVIKFTEMRDSFKHKSTTGLFFQQKRLN